MLTGIFPRHVSLVNMHLISLSNGKPHPRAKQAIIVIPMSECPDSASSIHVKGVYGDLLQFCAMPSNERIHDFCAVHLVHWPSSKTLKVGMRPIVMEA